jgi:hypothetical protein
MFITLNLLMALSRFCIAVLAGPDARLPPKVFGELGVENSAGVLARLTVGISWGECIEAGRGGVGALNGTESRLAGTMSAVCIEAGRGNPANGAESRRPVS